MKSNHESNWEISSPLLFVHVVIIMGQLAITTSWEILAEVKRAQCGFFSWFLLQPIRYFPSDITDSQLPHYDSSIPHYAKVHENLTSCGLLNKAGWLYMAVAVLLKILLWA